MKRLLPGFSKVSILEDEVWESSVKAQLDHREKVQALFFKYIKTGYLSVYIKSRKKSN